MTVPDTAPYVPRSLAARFLAIALGGVLLPLALVGLWLSRSAERAGITLLRTQLSDAAEVLTNRVSARWVLRDGDLQLLARNSSAVALLRGRELSDADRAYLREVVRGMAPALTEVTYRDAAGEVRWASTDAGAIGLFSRMGAGRTTVCRGARRDGRRNRRRTSRRNRARLRATVKCVATGFSAGAGALGGHHHPRRFAAGLVVSSRYD